MTPEPLLVGVRQAATELGIGRDTAYALVREGRLRHVSVGRRVLIPRSELTAFVVRESAKEEALMPAAMRELDAVRSATRRVLGDSTADAGMKAAEPHLPEDERLRRAEHLPRAHVSKLALKSAQARRKAVPK